MTEARFWRCVVSILAVLIGCWTVDEFGVVLSAETVTVQVNAPADDVNETSNSLDATSTTVWLGNGASTNASYTGLRFTDVPIPAGSTITSAYLQVYSAQNQWISLSFSLAADAAGNSAIFTSSSRPSQRTLTSNIVSHNDNVNWLANTWYSLDDMRLVIGEIVNRPDWQAGNSLSIILRGSGGAYARKFVGSIDGGAANAPRLIVTYTSAGTPLPTATLNVVPNAIDPGQSATLSWNTTMATTVFIDQGIGSVAASGSVTVNPAATTTYTLTATNAAGSTTATTTLIVGQPLPPTVTFSVSPDAIVSGSSATLSWTTGNADTVTIDQRIGSVGGAGSRSVNPTSTTTYTLTATNSAGSTSRSATLTVTPPGTIVIKQIGASEDDVNEANATFSTSATTVWLGNGGSRNKSYAGLRFNGVSVPPGATVTSAYLQVYSTQTQSVAVSYSIAADAAGNSSAFSGGATPSQRPRTAAMISHSDNVNWTADTWYALDEMKSVVQEVINRADWQSGNSLSIIIKGTGNNNADARKFVASFDGNSANASKLVVAYTTDSGSPAPTATISVTPTAISSGGSATLSWSTTNATSVVINQNIGNVAASGSLPVSPSVTTTYTITATNSSGSVSQSATLTVSTGNPSSTYFAVNAGFSDTVPHQVVRTGSDALYIFAVSQPFSSVVKAYWTTSPGLPASGADIAGSAQVTLPAAPISVSPAYDGAVTVHVVANLQNGSLVDVPFDVGTNTFKPVRTMATGSATVSGDYEGSSGVSTMLDLTGNLHVAYWTAGNQILHGAYTYNASTDTLSQASAFTRVDTSGAARHPSLAVSPVDNSVTVSWVSLATTPRRILARVRNASGNWGIVENVSNAAVDVWTSTSAGIDIDQGPSILVTGDGVKHLVYIENYDATGDYGSIHYVTNAGSGWVDLELTSTYSHDPALAVNSAGDLYIIGHGHPNDGVSACKSSDDMCVRKRNSNGTWGASALFARHTGGNSFDSSPSVKWSVVGWNRPEAIEFIFFQTPYSAPTIFYGRIQ